MWVGGYPRWYPTNFFLIPNQSVTRSGFKLKYQTYPQPTKLPAAGGFLMVGLGRFVGNFAIPKQGRDFMKLINGRQQSDSYDILLNP